LFKIGAAHRNKMFNPMANTYTQCYFHLVFAVKNRAALIKKEWKDELGKYIITGIVQAHRHKMLAVGSMPDHIHIFIGYNVNQLIPDLVEEIKTSTNAWIKEKRFSKFKFEWQKGYGAFTKSHSQIGRQIIYILSQEEHHKRRQFKEEYLEMLKENDVIFNNDYNFEFFDDNLN
jgi:putative transposase